MPRTSALSAPETHQTSTQAAAMLQAAARHATKHLTLLTPCEMSAYLPPSRVHRLAMCRRLLLDDEVDVAERLPLADDDGFALGKRLAARLEQDVIRAGINMLELEALA